MFIDFRETEGDGERNADVRNSSVKEKHQCETETWISCLPYVPQLEIEITT